MCIVQGYSQLLILNQASGTGSLLNHPIGLTGDAALPTFAAVMSMTAGTMFLVWLGELITEKGILMRTRVSEIRETGRNASGVRLIKIDDGDRLVAMAKIDADPEKPAGDGATGDGTGSTPVATELPPGDTTGASDDGNPSAQAEPGTDPE